jgi:hypothetical protein
MQHHGNNGDGEASEEDDILMDHERQIEYDEVRPHAGTGGSSKLRSRPN